MRLTKLHDLSITLQSQTQKKTWPKISYWLNDLSELSSPNVTIYYLPYIKI